MLDIKRILVPTDFSDYGQVSLPLAVRLAEEHDAELLFLHLQVLHGAQRMDAPDAFPGEEEARARLEKIAAKSGSRVRHEVKRAINASTGILDYAQAEDVDVIVMGAHGRRGVRRFLLGSVAEEVLRYSQAPVLIVRHHETRSPRPDIDRILVPVDFSRHAKSSFEAATELARTFEAGITLLHVVHTPVYPDFYVPASGSSLGTARIRQDARERLQKLAECADPELDVEFDSIVGVTPDAVCDFALKNGCDLIVMPTHSYSGLERVLLGSVTERVVRCAPCPVLALKPFGRDIRPNPATAVETAASRS